MRVTKKNVRGNYDEFGKATTIFDKLKGTIPEVSKDLSDILDLLSSEDISS